jgi:hypothetical protein
MDRMPGLRRMAERLNHQPTTLLLPWVISRAAR